MQHEVQVSEDARKLEPKMRSGSPGGLTASGEKVKQAHHVKFSSSPVMLVKPGVDGS